MGLESDLAALQALLDERDREIALLRAEQATRDGAVGRRVEERLRESEEEARDLIRYAPTGIYEIDFATGRFRLVNDAMCEILGYSREQLLGISAFELLDDEGRRLFSDRIRRTLAGEKVDPHVQYRVKRKDGRVIYAVLSTRLTYSGGQPDGAFVIAHDVTERRRSEEKLRQLNAELARREALLADTASKLQAQAGELEVRVRERTAELALQAQRLELLHAIDRAILAARSPVEIAEAALRAAGKAVGAARVSVLLYDAQSHALEILAVEGEVGALAGPGYRIPLDRYWVQDEVMQGRLGMVEDLLDLPASSFNRQAALDAGLRSYIAAPMSVGSRVIGALTAFHRVAGPFPPSTQNLIQQVADSLAVAIHNARLFEQLVERESALMETAERLEASREQLAQRETELQALTRRQAERQENERRYVAHQLYNEVSQVLSAFQIQLSLLKSGWENGRAPDEHLSLMSDTVDRALRELHHLAVHLRPATLDRLGLGAAVQQYLTEYGQECSVCAQFVATGLSRVRLPAATETTLYRIVQEALANAAVHASASNVGVAISLVGSRLVMTIEDDGVGFDPQEAMRHGALGLVGMHEAAAALGGSLEVESSAGHGTMVTVNVPVRESR